MVEENFDFQSSEKYQNEWFLQDFWVHAITIVEEIIDLQSSEMLQNEGF